ncbi:PREDICTED: uncharacterized protein LOC104591975 [Nelumbo nucifera]|uniref:Uncharacterized protein LOC104591975 n=1 Tax=Nelumbo nucifera TaxID=4432 RepID=A0A1U7Z7S4_NELNU|nr:PREDICTED: uncharacterized protein LOC104591975 [Nelumbo nucifera]
MKIKLLFLLVVCFHVLNPNVLLPEQPAIATALPLYTDSRWIVDESGKRVKLACANWVSHLQPVLAEGLNRQPLDVISKWIVSMGFNCIRLTWPLWVATNDTLASLTVQQSFESLGLLESIGAIRVNNPSMLNLTIIQAFQAVVSNLGKNGVMVIIDNHISQPGWCCANRDGNGFFGDIYFDPDLWIKGLTRMATLFNGTSNVIGMSLRNELRGPKQNVSVWYKYMQQGAEAVHRANPDVLTILSGLDYDKDLHFLRNQPLNLSFTRKLVFELHWYSFSDGDAWSTGNPNQVCGRVVNALKDKILFVLDQGYPLFVSEFGIDLRGGSLADNRYSNCIFGVAAELDFDWALWAFMGSYYLREGVMGLDEVYAVMNWGWSGPRNSTFLRRLSALQSPFRGAGLDEVAPYQILYHPLTGLCVQRGSFKKPLDLKLGSCAESAQWMYTPEMTLAVNGTTVLCLQADGLGRRAKLRGDCSSPATKWKPISDSRMHLSTTLPTNSTACLDIDSKNNIIASRCQCLWGDASCDPASQWFKIIYSTIRRY